MTAPPLTIRNLTSTPLELKLIERFETRTHHGLSSFTHNITSLASNATAPRLADNAESFARQDVDVHLDPFATQNTDIKTSERSPSEILRLTFEQDGQRYRLDTPTPGSASDVLVPLTPDPRRQYTAVYLPDTSFLTVYSSANLQSWMKELADATPISALSIPGTHNSPTHHKALPSVRCQAVSPREQLDNGVRFFDIRVKPENPNDPADDRLELVHGVFPISLTGPKHFRKLVDQVQDFLRQNPSETLIMSIKREGPGQATDQQLSCILRDHYAGDTAQWYTEPRQPSLGEARGKI
ncbi:hypothetical protein LTR66_012392, partial [Elasticomyces elasticus]